jgi:dTDP-4-dehydrorhamnose reductase
LIVVKNAAPIFVAGKSGQLAQCLSHIARRRALPIAVAGRPEFDIELPELIDSVLNKLKPKIIINAAAYTAVDKAETEPERCYFVNRDGAGRLAEAAWRRKLPFIHISTDYVFDGQKASPYREDDRTAPLGVYGCSKLEGEHSVLAAHPEALILRTSWVYSAFGSNFVKTILQLAETQPLLPVVDDQHGGPTSAHDLAAALFDIVPQLLEAGAERRAGIYHLSGTGQTTWYGFAAEILANIKKRGRRIPALKAIRTADYPTLAQRPANSALDCAKVECAFGIKLPPWSASVADCTNELTKHKELQPC